MGDTVYVSRFYADVINVGAINLKSIEIAYPSTAGYGDVAEIPLNKMPVISANLIVVTEV